MTSEPERKKRKMEPHLGGDTCRVLEESVQKFPSGSASGDYIEIEGLYGSRECVTYFYVSP